MPRSAVPLLPPSIESNNTTKNGPPRLSPKDPTTPRDHRKIQRDPYRLRRSSAIQNPIYTRSPSPKARILDGRPRPMTTSAPTTARMRTSTSPSTRKLRVLCLHGTHTNAHVMRDQTQALRRALDPDADFVYLNAPLEAQGKADAMIEEHYDRVRPFYEWVRFYIGESEHAISISTPEVAAQLRESAGKDTEWFMRYYGLSDAIAYADDFIRKHEPFDVVIGFSQGAMFLTVLTMWYLRTQNECPWKLNVCVGGIRVNGTDCRSLFETTEGKALLVPFPSVHIIGKQDPINEETQKLAAMYDPSPVGSLVEKIVLEHEEGHRFPSFKKNKSLYATLIHAIRLHGRDEKSARHQRIAKL